MFGLEKRIDERWETLIEASQGQDACGVPYIYGNQSVHRLMIIGTHHMANNLGPGEYRIVLINARGKFRYSNSFTINRALYTSKMHYRKGDTLEAMFHCGDCIGILFSTCSGAYYALETVEDGKWIDVGSASRCLSIYEDYLYYKSQGSFKINWQRPGQYRVRVVILMKNQEQENKIENFRKRIQSEKDWYSNIFYVH